MAEIARRRLRLDEVWLLVSPGNPLKPRAGMAPLAERLASARKISDGRRVIATDINAAALEQVRVILRRGASYQRQRAVARRNAGDLDAVVRSLLDELRSGRPL